ncbi:TPA: hypothetical protein ACNUUR_000716 [Aeromonas salmonicida]
MDPIVNIINILIQNHLPAINQAIQSEILNRDLDPWVHVTSANDRLGTINLEVCTAYVEVGYEVDNMRGLSSVQISSLEVNTCGQNPQNSDEVNGTVNIAARSGGICTGLGGHAEAGCGFLCPSVGLSGTVSASGVSAIGSGSFQAQIKGEQICLTNVRLGQLNLSYDNLSVNIDGLGIFNDFLHPLEDLILKQFNNQISNQIASALTPVLNSQVGIILPLCANLSV